MKATVQYYDRKRDYYSGFLSAAYNLHSKWCLISRNTNMVSRITQGSKKQLFKKSN